MAPAQPIIFVVDDDPGMRGSLQLLLETLNYQVKTYASAQEFLSDFDSDAHGCLVLDVYMPGFTGVELQDELARRNVRIPIIFLTGHGDIPMAVRTIQHGAVNFLPKPFEKEVLLSSIRQAIEHDARTREAKVHEAEVEGKVSLLSQREKQVVDLILTGHPNKSVAFQLGISERTVEKHRARVMQKLKVRSLPELTRLIGEWERQHERPISDVRKEPTDAPSGHQDQPA